MRTYIATVEVQRRGDSVSGRERARLLRVLAEQRPVLGTSERGWLEARLRVRANGLAQATSFAGAVMIASTSADTIACQVMTEDEFDARQGARGAAAEGRESPGAPHCADHQLAG